MPLQELFPLPAGTVLWPGPRQERKRERTRMIGLGPSGCLGRGGLEVVTRGTGRPVGTRPLFSATGPEQFPGGSHIPADGQGASLGATKWGKPVKPRDARKWERKVRDEAPNPPSGRSDWADSASTSRRHLRPVVVDGRFGVGGRHANPARTKRADNQMVLALGQTALEAQPVVRLRVCRAQRRCPLGADG